MGVNDNTQTFWYFAYGANMSSAVFEERREMRALDKRIGRLQGYSLAFNQPGIPLLEPGFANIRSDTHGEVQGVLWKISADDFARLDLQRCFMLLSVLAVGTKLMPMHLPNPCIELAKTPCPGRAEETCRASK